LQATLTQPIWGWFSQRDQFAMGPDYQPRPDIGRMLIGTPSILALAAADAGISVSAEAGIDATGIQTAVSGRWP
jgi:kynureninase